MKVNRLVFLTPALALLASLRLMESICRHQLSVDLCLCVLTIWIAFYLSLGEFVVLSSTALWAVGASVGITLLIFVVSGMYRVIFRFSGWPALLAVGRAVGLYGLLYASIFNAIIVAGLPRTVGIIQPILLL